jgi:hypothetical protein
VTPASRLTEMAPREVGPGSRSGPPSEIAPSLPPRQRPLPVYGCGHPARHRTQARAYSLASRCSLTAAGGKMRSYIARASRIRRARSGSDFGINRTILPT